MATKLPAPFRDNKTSVETALRRRRSVRSYADAPLTLHEVSQLLWAAQGITSPDGKRTAPSAGALYPLEVYLAAADIHGLEPGLYKYRPHGHELFRLAEIDKRSEIAAAAHGQRWIEKAPGVLVIAGVFERTAGKYGNRAGRYVHMEVGHAAQNVSLQAVPLGLGTAAVGAFDDNWLKRIMMMDVRESPLSIMPVGKLDPTP